ncbi:MAG TPA: sporulation protein YunB [Clostridia bacterium]|nr:sporulation protein YunB [Clostridia bacterium]
MRWGRGRKKSVKIMIILIIFFIAGIYGFTILERNLKDTILAYAEVQATALAVSIMNKADDGIINNVNYNDLVYVQTDVNGRVVLMQPNSLKLNEMTNAVVENIQKAFQEAGELEIKIPIGQALGSKLLASKGPKIKAKIIPIGNVNANLRDEFLEAGINQTKHRIVMDVVVKVRVVVPLVSSEIVVDNETPLAETIIVGEVPEQYFNLHVGKY